MYKRQVVYNVEGNSGDACRQKQYTVGSSSIYGLSLIHILLDNRYALLFVRGERPVMDFKYDILKHPNVKLTADGGQPPYIHGEPTQAVATLVFDSDIPDNAVSVKAVSTSYELLSDEDLEEIFNL